MMRILLLAACLGLAAYGSVVVMLYVRQDGLIFPRTDAPLADPSSTIGGMGRVTLHTTDGLDLAAWYRPPSGDTGPEGMVVVYLHGNAGSLNGRRERFRDFAQAGFGVLGVEYRGYAGNPGRPDEDGLVRDAAAAMAFLKERGVAPARVVVYGESLGTNVAVRTALAYRVAGVILDSPYTSIADVAARRYPWMPVHTLIRNPFDTLSRVGALEVPVLVLRAAHDRTVPPDLSLRVFEAVRTRKEVWTSETATHATVLEHGGLAVACRFVTRVSPARI